MEPRTSTPFSSGVYQVPWERVVTPLATRSVILAGIFTCPRSLYTRTISPSWMLRAAASSGWIQRRWGSSLRSPRLLSWTVWVRHLLCQPDNCSGKQLVSGSSGPSGGATYRGIGGIKSFIGVFHNLVENSSIFPLGVGNG